MSAKISRCFFANFTRFFCRILRLMCFNSFTGPSQYCNGRYNLQQDSIPVGCVPPVSGPGGVVSQHALRQTPPLWTEWQTGVKISPCRKLRLRAVIKLINLQYSGSCRCLLCMTHNRWPPSNLPFHIHGNKSRNLVAHNSWRKRSTFHPIFERISSVWDPRYWAFLCSVSKVIPWVSRHLY